MDEGTLGGRKKVAENSYKTDVTAGGSMQRKLYRGRARGRECENIQGGSRWNPRGIHGKIKCPSLARASLSCVILHRY